MLLKKKQSWKMKARGCTNGHPQQKYITKEESSLPTVSLYALMSSCVMNALDNRKVITVDISDEFLQGDWPQYEHPGYTMIEGIMM